jgi:Kef-type K+ transport system membrane component KefB/Trk K+ transport system NAD-binding subunit
VFPATAHPFVLPALASAGGPDALVRDIGLCLLFAFLLAALFARFRVPAIAAFLAAGVAIGPVGTALITDDHNIKTIASLGLVLLLFLIGLEIDFRKLLGSGRVLIVAGLLQFPLCVAFGWAVDTAAAWTGWPELQGRYLPLYAGFVAAASSTLVCVKLLQERGQMDTVAGRVAVGILIFQDVWAIVVLAAQPNFANPRIAPVAATFAGIGALSVMAWTMAKYVLPGAFRGLARQPELMLVAATGWCFGVGFLGQNLGVPLELLGVHADVSVSLEMGALIAGAAIASFPYSTQVISKIGVVHDFFITLFFVALGMQVPLPEGPGPVLLALFFVLVAAASRIAVFLPLFHFSGMDRRNSVVTAVKLYPISEFCLVILYLGMQMGHVPESAVAATIFAFVITALTAPFFFERGDAIHGALAPVLSTLGMAAPSQAAAGAAGGGHGHGADIVLLGLHRTASSLLRDVETRRPDLLGRVLVVDYNVALHAEVERRGFRTMYGDISSVETLQHAGIGSAKVVVCTIPDDLLKDTSNLRIVQAVRGITTGARLIVNALTAASAREMYDAGADYVYLQRLDSAERLDGLLEGALAGDLAAAAAAQEERFRLSTRSEILP